MVTKSGLVAVKLYASMSLVVFAYFYKSTFILDSAYMAAQYWVGNFFIDLTRNQITQKTQSQTIPPKALAVLTYLAKNANKVVSHDELLSEVWPDTVVTPNTLQRSIAQLRKALGEDSQYQSYIKTHAKQGYSLEVEVRWQDKTETESLIPQDPTIDSPQAHKVTQPNLDSPSLDNTEHTKSLSYTLRLISIFAGIVILGFICVKYLIPEQPFKLAVGELRSLTTTDNKEHSGIYSPDGEYIVFNRYSEKLCSSSNVWAKNIKTQKETQLTKNVGLYGSLSFSKDGKKLVFIETENCNKPITQTDCYKLMTLDFEKALAAPQSPNLLMECKNSRITKSTWLNNNNVALMQKFSNRWKLASYSIADNKSRVIYSIEDGNIIDYDYSVKDDLIALTSIHNDGQHYIEILEPDGEVLSSHQIEYPPEIPNLRFIYPNFTPTSEQLIFSTGRQLFTLSYEGKITNISLPLDKPMGSPIFHPDGKRALMIKGLWDSDIATIPLLQLTQTQAGQTLIKGNNHYSIIERSTVGEENAIFQPNGELIAFKSRRSGDNQIWITDGNGSQQLTHFPIDSYIYGLDWAADGQSILVNANNTLTQVTLDSNETPFQLEHPVVQLFQWNSEDNSALLLVRIKGILKFGEFNLNNSEFSVITDKKVNWALKSEDGRLIYTDHLNRFWQPGPAEDQLIDSLEGKGGKEQRFKIKNNVVYGINEEVQLWSYDLNKDKFEVLGNMPKNMDSLTDINQTDILLTIRIAAKKEVAELILAK
jgi:DNA-binding winged helix-turn-helix (wHTH) protein/Tol biopolymer transport system component